MNGQRITATVISDSKSGDSRITTFLLTYPRIIHSELMTHCALAKNSASSRAIPFKTMVESVTVDPFIPVAWQKDHKGMQGTKYITDPVAIENLRSQWIAASLSALSAAKGLNAGAYTYEVSRVGSEIMRGLSLIEIPDTSVTKQLCNRLLEPFLWHTTLVTATEWDNFFELRCPKYWLGNPMDTNLYKSRKEARKSIEDIGYAPNPPFDEWTDTTWLSMSVASAEVHIQLLAEAIYEAMNESTPKELKAGEWHIPFGDKIDESLLHQATEAARLGAASLQSIEEMKLKIATARCARLSYMTFDKEIDYLKDFKLHDQLLKDNHMSPFEHCAKPHETGVAKYKGFISYRHTIEK